MNTHPFARRLGRALVATVVVTSAFAGSALAASGAIWTTDVTCGGVNINIFNDKQAVYVNGGPAGGGPGLSNGNYFIQVTEPDGTPLGKSPGADLVVAGGNFVSCYQLWAVVKSTSSAYSVTGYDTTTNLGGEYKVWVSQNGDFTGGTNKTDNFKVKPVVVLPKGTLNVIKFYDANANGLNDDGQLITGWKMHIQDGIDFIRYTPVTIVVDPDLYTVTEFMPVESNWRTTTPNPQQVQIDDGDNDTLAFGNLCLGAGGGKTLGFWSNRNGQAMIGADDLALLTSLNLRNASGAAFDPANYAALRSWLLGGTATNMAYMLSVQMAATQLNVHNGLVNGGAIVYAPGTNSANALGYAPVNALLAEANTELGLHGIALSGDAWRAYQEALKNAFDNANNNLTFVQPTPCAFTFAD
jgi:hypothetical protein